MFAFAVCLALAQPTTDPHKETGFQVPDAAVQQEKPATQESGPAPVSTMLTLITSFGVAVLALTFLTIAGELVIMCRRGLGWDDLGSVRIVCVTLVLGLGTFLVVAGYSSSQMAGVVGLFGAVLGFVFGKASPKRPPPP